MVKNAVPVGGTDRSVDEPCTVFYEKKDIDLLFKKQKEEIAIRIMF